MKKSTTSEQKIERDFFLEKRYILLYPLKNETIDKVKDTSVSIMSRIISLEPIELFWP